ncbi:OsmC family protein [Phyllobacterium myrsinacearum]|uniref:Putative OsmC-like protein n=1 Tax=Phyllobacterium myrsinacearum TaxID=28101 RepID=A0A839EMR9_9HYPH|nr:OsmC family protein [Phyllobacterium myrsinacearum]MBA8877960.1 putative OsmC-like protein [Phyllobacterium myrsinacearum]
MAELKIRTRDVGATAVLLHGGQPVVTSHTGGVLNVAHAVSEAGFGPLDLLYASLSACLVLSAKMAAARLGVAGKLETVEAHVTGDKAKEGLSRVERFHIAFTITGDIDAATRHAIVEAAENEICTVSNTLRGNPSFTTTVG